MLRIKIGCIFILCFPLFIFAQKVDLTYDQANDINFVESYKDNTLIDSYKTKDGVIINVGDTLTIGNAVIKRKKRSLSQGIQHQKIKGGV